MSGGNPRHFSEREDVGVALGGRWRRGVARATDENTGEWERESRTVRTGGRA